MKSHTLIGVVSLLLCSFAALMCATQAAAQPGNPTMDERLKNGSVVELAELSFEHASRVIAEKSDCTAITRDLVLDEIAHPLGLAVLEEAHQADPLGVYVHVAIRAVKAMELSENVGCKLNAGKAPRQACRVGRMVKYFIDENMVTEATSSTDALRGMVFTAFDNPVASPDDAQAALRHTAVPTAVSSYDIGARGESCNTAGRTIYNT